MFWIPVYSKYWFNLLLCYIEIQAQYRWSLFWINQFRSLDFSLLIPTLDTNLWIIRDILIAGDKMEGHNTNWLMGVLAIGSHN